MKPFSDLSDAEFEKWKNAVSAELARREHAAVALEKIRKIVLEYKLTAAELEAADIFSTKRNKSKSRQRKSVAPKYHDGTHTNFWSGRGRAPRWVVDICERLECTVLEFKARDEFLVSSD